MSRIGLPFFMLCLSGFLFCSAGSSAAASREDIAFTGSPACAPCHAEIYQRFTSSSGKADTRRDVEKMLDKLTPEEQGTCFGCHATGYGKKGGFISYAQTPDLGDVGCESCHGPGGAHVETSSKDDIRRKPAPEQCLTCHDSRTVRPRKFNPLIYSGAH